MIEQADLLGHLRAILTADTPDHGAVRLRALAALEGYADLPRGGELERIARLAGVTRATAYRARKGDDAAAIHADPLPEASVETTLYRYFDASDLLLYIGISDRLTARTGGHVKDSSWMDFAVRSTIERFPSREEAIEAETAAIKAECPLFNYQHNASPETRRRLIEYLIGHGRLDLLAPAVSRG